MDDVKSVSSVKLFGVETDDKLNFNLHISNVCDQLIVICNHSTDCNAKTKNYFSFDARKLYINGNFLSNFSYCPLVWMFSSAKSLKAT